MEGKKMGGAGVSKGMEKAKGGVHRRSESKKLRRKGKN